MEQNQDVKIELAVKMTCGKCETAVQKALESHKDIRSFDIDLKNERVMVQTILPAEEVVDLIEKSGRKAIVRGVGTIASGMKGMDFGSGVSILHKNADQEVTGVARFFQPNDDSCIVEGKLDGLTPRGKHAVRIHELGDLSDGCKSCGPVYRHVESGVEAGDLGVLTADDAGRVRFRLYSTDIKLWNLIGRSLVLHDLNQGKSDNRIACGIIARSAGLLANEKKVCACDGVTLWEEKDRATRLPSAAL